MGNLNRLINEAFLEDHVKQDITAKSLVPASRRAKAELLCKQDGVICGLSVINLIFKKLDKKSIIQWFVKDGQSVIKGKRIALISCSALALLSAERTALNFIQHLSGIATSTKTFADKVKGTKIKIFDTRKTIPGLRELEKYAVRCGGGVNHRFNLEEMVMIKDNHLKLDSDIKKSVKKIKAKYPKVKVEVECTDLSQVKDVLESGAEIIMLDNMPIERIKESIALIRKINKKVQIEISGGVKLNNIKNYTKLDIDRISIGAITHSVPALDISLEIL